MILDFATLSATERYFAMVQSIIPRPIAWVLSDNGENRGFNLAPFSFFTGICSDPPLLMFSVGKKTTGAETGNIKDTAVNIQVRKHFVVHIANTQQLNLLNNSAATLDFGISELDAFNIQTTPFEGSPLPRVIDCPIAMSCTLYKIEEIGNSPQQLVFGEIKKLYVDDTLLTPNHSSRLQIDSQKLDPLVRLGGSFYGSLGELLVANRPT